MRQAIAERLEAGFQGLAGSVPVFAAGDAADHRHRPWPAHDAARASTQRTLCLGGWPVHTCGRRDPCQRLYIATTLLQVTTPLPSPRSSRPAHRTK